MTAFHISLVGRKNLSGEIYRQIRRAVLDRRLRPGDPLPPGRELARTLAVSRATVTVVYERLAAEGFVTSRQGSGTFISELVVPAGREKTGRRSTGVLQPRQIWEAIAPPPAFEPVRFDFHAGFCDASLFPHGTWRRSVVWALRSSEATAGTYEHPAGHHDLRVAIARHIGISRGIGAAADDIIVTNGTQQALDVLARVLLAPGDAIAIEDPGYGPPRHLFKALGIRVVGVPVDRQGLVVDALPRGVRAVYVTPSHQFPLSVTMTLPRRQALLAWAERNNAAIIEDDYDSEFRFGGRPLEPLQTLDAKGRVIYVGSFSKTMLPTLRLGFILTPPSLRAAVHKAKFVSDWHSSTPAQAALARFIDEGAFARHIRRVNAIYRERHQIIADAIANDFAGHLELIPSTTGLHLTALARKMSADRIAEVARRAADRSVAVQILSRFAVNAIPRAGIMLGYGAIPTPRIEEGLHLLRACFDSEPP
ncbi:PLP-dependent aminotransferase family protein [Mesorhizobium sp. B2-4-4]|uniref:MocR-like pyridoxine biosynthesis transcription factor PdxR n=1 Tax=Mesorhizobium sp. B2-4-4 TaxID=2589945 RepID=UPI00112B61F4|nr:PLP-dependent aminotransferase family protein [Mesorhizobium sp. B2-4-4]TPL50770.1 PLP-dependent aminotransferase family protein [Mesorhizobium sp. B2-4-4]